MVDLLLEARASTKMVTHDTQTSCLHMAAKNNAVRHVTTRANSNRPLSCRVSFSFLCVAAEFVLSPSAAAAADGTLCTYGIFFFSGTGRPGTDGARERE